MRTLIYPFIVTVLSSNVLFGAVIEQTASRDRNVQLVSSTAESVVLRSDLTGLNNEISEVNGQQYSSFSLPDEATTCYPGRPVLPMVSRFVVVSPTSNLELVIQAPEPRRVQADTPPLLYSAEPGVTLESQDDSGVFPPLIAEMGEPFIIRGVRMVKVTVFPVRYDSRSNEYLIYDGVETVVRTCGGEAVNPVINADRHHRSTQFLKFMEALAINGDQVGRDQPLDEIAPYVGHYLVVTHESCLEYAAPFIEWRRKSGYKVDILSFNSQDANNPATVKNAIQDYYDSYLDNNIDPFDYILLIGDRSSYNNGGPNPQWVLNAETGESLWQNPSHADYKYACLEGNDNIPDVGFSRWPNGNRDLMELVVGKTLAYETTPPMDDPELFGKTGVYSQHWGNSSTSSWHPSIHTTVRWGVEVLESLGFANVDAYENMEWDQQGQRIGPWIRDHYNDGTNILIGRAQNYFWRSDFNGVNDNTAFTVDLNIGHFPWTSENSYRTGNGRHLKGPVAVTYCYSEPSAMTPMNLVWLNLVKGVLLDDLPLGWGLTFAVTAFELSYPNIRYNNQDVYLQVKTDYGCFSDPGLQPWIGVPTSVNVDFPEQLSPGARAIAAHVTSRENNENLMGAQVTIYHPGDMPEPNSGDYATYDGMFMMTAISDERGVASFVFPEDEELEPGTMFVTVSGRNICPEFGEISVSQPNLALDISSYTLTQVAGNNDADINPGEIFDLTINATNLGGEDVAENPIATVISLSDWIEIDGDSLITFGSIDPNEEAEGDQDIRLIISPACPDANSRPVTSPIVSVTFNANNATWVSGIKLNPVAPNLVVNQVIDSDIIEVDQTEIDIELKNVGGIGSSRCSAELVALEYGVTVAQEFSEYPAIQTGATSTVDSDPFVVFGNALAVPGTRVEMALILSNEEGFVDTAYFELQARSPQENAPQGPDKYGYICFDDTDQDWDIAPEYEWIEINPEAEDRAFDGELLDVEGQSELDIGESLVIALGFQTQFYGQLFDSITVATNGFIAMGSQPRIVNFQNWPLDRGIGGGVGMIAPLWTDLRMDQNSAVFVYHDQERSRMIIEWSNMKYTSGNLRLTFQVILLDCDVWVTESGDQDILLQYKDVEIIRNIRNGDQEWTSAVPFPSVGISSPDGKTGISYAWNNEYPITSAPIVDQRALLFSTSPRYLTCSIDGFVGDAQTGLPIEGARIYTRHGFVAFTNEEGYWEIPNALAEVAFDITASRQGYNDSTIFIEDGVAENDSLEINFNLLHPEFSLSRWFFSGWLVAGDSLESQFTLTNTGNGPLDWSAEKRLLDDANAEPWDLRRRYPISQITDDDRIEGVIFAEDKFYITGANGGDNNMIYILNRECELLDSFQQVGSSRYGYKDIDWDGEYIWAVGEDSIYALTTSGVVAAQWLDPQPDQYVAFNSEDGVLYVSGTTTDIIRFDRAGNRLEGDIDNLGLRTYGLAYWPEDPDGFDLYIINHPVTNNNLSVITKMNIETNDTMSVRIVPQDGGSTGQFGACITNEFDVYSWVFMSIQNISGGEGGDRLDIHQLEARKEWMDLDIWGGRIEAEGSQDLTLKLDATDLPDTTFVGEILFHHNADDGVTHFSIELTVSDIPPVHRFELLLPVNGDTIYTVGRNMPELRFVWSSYFDSLGVDTAISYVQWLSVESGSVHYSFADTFSVIDLDSLRQYILMEDRLTWNVAAVCGQDTNWVLQPFILNIMPFSMDNDPITPAEFGLRSIYPNPFNGITTIRYSLPEASDIKLSVFDLNGREIAVIASGNTLTGVHNTVWNADGVGSGLYFVRLEAGTKTMTQKVMLVK